MHKNILKINMLSLPSSWLYISTAFSIVASLSHEEAQRILDYTKFIYDVTELKDDVDYNGNQDNAIIHAGKRQDLRKQVHIFNDNLLKN